MTFALRGFGLVLAALLCAGPALGAEDVPLTTQLRALTAAHQGKVALFALDLRSGRTAAIDADTPVPTESVIKLAVLFEALEQIRDGRAHFEETVTLRKSDQVEGSGVLTFFDTPQTLTLKDALTMMIVVSDNTAANLAIDRLGLKNIDRRLVWLGLTNTWLYKKVFLPPVPPVPADQKQFGLGKTTAREMAQLMRRFVDCNLNAPGEPVNPSTQDRKLCGVAMDMLENQTDRDAIPRYVQSLAAPGKELVVANKTGADDAVRNDVAVVYARGGPILISGFTYDNKDQSWTPDNAALILMATLARTIVERWQ